LRRRLGHLGRQYVCPFPVNHGDDVQILRIVDHHVSVPHVIACQLERAEIVITVDELGDARNELMAKDKLGFRIRSVID
jgi:hypothetical protein